VPCERGDFGIYIHFPFCRSKCGYCDFPSVAEQQIPHRAYADAVLAELDLRAHHFETYLLRSVYFGGGTPSLWETEQLRRVLRAVFQRFDRVGEIEVTLELNPGSIDDPATYAGLIESGVNRLSIGVQSLDDRYLELLQRPHDGRSARLAVDQARRAGFHNISCDLIFGLPRQSLDHQLEQIGQLVELSPSHLSTYSLTLGPTAPLRRQKGVTLPTEEVVAEMMERGRGALASAGFVQYEVSSFARPGLESVHNSLVWAGRPYLGLGAFAHSMSFREGKTYRVQNPPIDRYLASSDERGPGAAPDEVARIAGASLEVVDEPMSRLEMVFLGLRTVAGLDRRAYSLRFGADVLEHYGSGVKRLQEQGLVECDRFRVAPTARGIWFADGLAEHLLDLGFEEKPFHIKPDRGR
jgi:oxygen-independent coproporphyrinogen-3 oxidase